MNKEQKEIIQSQLNNEKKTIKELKEVYSQALNDCETKIKELSMRKDLENLQSIIYQKQYQQAIKGQLEGILEQLHGDSFATVSDYLARCYEDGFVGTMYDLAGQGIPLIVPIDQSQVVQAIQTDSKLSKSLYDRLGEDVNDLKKAVRQEVSRGIANGSSWNDVAENLASNFKNTPFSKAYNNSIRIARTEGHRISIQAASDAQHKAKDKGADVVKQWDSTLDGRTRDSHRKLDGQIRELDDDFEVNGMRASAPSMFGRASEDVNCRCALLQRAKWALDDDELEALRERAAYHGLMVDDSKEYGHAKAKDFSDFKEKYLNSIKQFNDALRIEFPDDVYKINGFTESVKSEVDSAMQKLNNEYEIHLNSIVVEPAEKGDIFVTGYHDGVVDMVVNQNADFEKIISRIEEKYKSGQFAGKSLEDYLAHEMAHCMLYQDCTSDFEYNAKYSQIESLFEQLQGISGYADKKKSGNEALAEAFVRVRNNEEVSPIAKVLVKSYFGKWKK